MLVHLSPRDIGQLTDGQRRRPGLAGAISLLPVARPVCADQPAEAGPTQPTILRPASRPAPSPTLPRPPQRGFSTPRSARRLSTASLDQLSGRNMVLTLGRDEVTTNNTVR